MTTPNVDIAATVPSSLDSILATAMDVLRDYGDEPSNTRIVAMAQFIVANFGGEGDPLTGELHLLKDKLGYLHKGETMYRKFTATEARTFVVALLRGCEALEI